MTKKVALVTGVGPGTGSAIVRRFAEGHYEVAMIARRRGSLMRGGVDRCRPVYPPLRSTPSVYTLGPGRGKK
jgi:NAD(P)-dependent dehydrogenase (short-subunit alcohol dehydrogenase family)